MAIVVLIIIYSLFWIFTKQSAEWNQHDLQSAWDESRHEVLSIISLPCPWLVDANDRFGRI